MWQGIGVCRLLGMAGILVIAQHSTAWLVLASPDSAVLSYLEGSGPFLVVIHHILQLYVYCLRASLTREQLAGTSSSLPAQRTSVMVNKPPSGR